jgi:hypothetical protein
MLRADQTTTSRCPVVRTCCNETSGGSRHCLPAGNHCGYCTGQCTVSTDCTVTCTVSTDCTVTCTVSTDCTVTLHINCSCFIGPAPQLDLTLVFSASQTTVQWALHCTALYCMPMQLSVTLDPLQPGVCRRLLSDFTPRYIVPTRVLIRGRLICGILSMFPTAGLYCEYSP